MSINTAIEKCDLEKESFSYPVTFKITDTLKKDFPFKKSYPITTKTYRNNTDFFIKYPSIGLWALGVTAIISVWFILVVIFFANLSDFKQTLNTYSTTAEVKLTFKEIWYFIFSFIAVFLFFIVGKLTVYDKSNIIPANLFINHYMGKFYFLLFTGLTVASLFFGGYLMMGDVMKECTLKRAAFEKDKVANQNKIDAICILYDIAVKNLKSYFITTALSLTGIVIVTGILFTAVNNFDFGKMYYQSFGKNLLSYDIIYLFGACIPF